MAKKKLDAIDIAAQQRAREQAGRASFRSWRENSVQLSPQVVWKFKPELFDGRQIWPYYLRLWLSS